MGSQWKKCSLWWRNTPKGFFRFHTGERKKEACFVKDAFEAVT